MQQDAVQKAQQTEKTDFTELNATFQIADGIARNNDLDLKSPFLRIGGDGAHRYRHAGASTTLRARPSADTPRARTARSWPH